MKKQTEETAIKHQVRDYLRHMGWFVFHVLQGLGSYKGISDMIACKDGVVLFVEIKNPRGKQSDNQIKFQSDIEERGGRYLIARSWEDVSAYISGMDALGDDAPGKTKAESDLGDFQS